MPCLMNQTREVYARYDGCQVAEFKGGSITATITCTLPVADLEELETVFTYVAMFTKNYGDGTVTRDEHQLQAVWYKHVPPPGPEWAHYPART
jgi:hypothetical protein